MIHPTKFRSRFKKVKEEEVENNQTKYIFWLNPTLVASSYHATTLNYKLEKTPSYEE